MHDAASDTPTFGLPPELRIPIAARDLAALARFVGQVSAIGSSAMVRPRSDPASLARVMADHRRPQWFRTRYRELVTAEQLWVAPRDDSYRSLYVARCGKLPAGLDVDHTLSRAFALRMGYTLVRLVAVTAAANRSAGSSGERMAVQSGPGPAALPPSGLPPIAYADPADLTKLFNHTQSGCLLAGVAAFQRYLFLDRGA